MIPPNLLTHPRRITGEQLVAYGVVIGFGARVLAALAWLRLVQLEGPVLVPAGVLWLLVDVGGRRLRTRGQERMREQYYAALQQPLRPEFEGF